MQKIVESNAALPVRAVTSRTVFALLRGPEGKAFDPESSR